MALTPSQQAAVDWTGNLVMFAGPGSGKTSTSIEKVTKILSCPENSMLMTTFTKEAAVEMRLRLDKKFAESGLPPVPESRLRISTFDSLTLWHIKSVSSGQVKLLSPQAQMPRLWQLCAELQLGKYENHSSWFDAYQSVIDREPLLEQIEQESPDSIRLIEAYYDWLRSGGMMDLATIKRTVAIQMRDGNMPLLPFNHMLVDESQDCDELQVLIATTQGKNGCSTTLVGDDDQTIYDWRSAAGYKGMITFKNECKAEIVRLAENFRSHTEIVDHATQLIRFNNPGRVEKNQVAVKGQGGVVKVACFKDIESQAEWVAGHISENLLSPYSCAILSRTNINLDSAEAACREYGLPSHRVGSSLWDRDDIAAYTAMMTYWLSGGADMLSQAMGLLGFGRVTVNGVLSQTRSNKNAFLRGTPVDIPGASFDETEVLNSMCQAFAKWRKDTMEASRVYDSEKAPDVFNGVIEESIYMFPDWYSRLGANAKRNGNEHPKVTRMKSGLAHVRTVLMRVQGHLKGRIRLLRTKKRDEPEEGAIRLMTMHGSKGLEFDHVYIIGADEKPDDNTVTAGPAERRVMFVGMTRARKHLSVTYSGKFPLFMDEAGIPFSQVAMSPPALKSATEVVAMEGDDQICE